MKMVRRNVSYIIVVIVFLFFSGCSYESPVVALTHIEWYTTTEKIDGLTFGFIHLSISGVTNGDKITVMTYGDGVILEYEVTLDENNQFNEDVVIAFTHMADDEPRTYSTIITAYKGNCSNQKELVSEELTYLKNR